MAKLNLSDEINNILSKYHDEIVENVNEIGHETIKKLTNETRKNAPKKTGAYKKHIAWMSRQNQSTGDKTYTWHVKGEFSSLTHLLTNGHATRNGGRVPGNPFLKNATENAISEYENAIIELLKSKS